MKTISERGRERPAQDKTKEALQFFREYSGRLNDWQRKKYSDGKIRNVATHKLFDIFRSGCFNDTVKRLSENVYVVSPQVYSYLKAEGYLAMFSNMDIKEEEKE